jgi:phosphoadenosine phosphosulfate reductase
MKQFDEVETPKVMLNAPMVAKAIDQFDEPIVAFSGGNCSLVILHMAIQIKPDILVCFCDTTNEYQETYDFIKKVWKEWNLNLKWIKPKKTWVECYQEYGPPNFRAKGKGSNVPRCCNWLKEEPAKRAYKELEVDCVIDGIRMEESHQRFCFGKRYGPLHYAKTWKVWKAHPILHWIIDDVWAYIRMNKIPYNPKYDQGIRRIGCRGCTAHMNWEKEVIEHSGMNMYEWIQKKKGQSLLKVK